MNKDRRKQIELAQARLDELVSLAETIKEEIESIRDDEQDYFDSMPENMQGGEKGEAAEQAVQSLEEVIDELDNIVSGGSSWIESLSAAAE